MKIRGLIILISFLSISCKNSKLDLEYDRSKVKIFATQDAPLESINFILFENNEFKVQKFGLFESQNFNGKAKIKGDSIYLEYDKKEIDFKEIPLPIKMKVDKNQIDTEFSDGHAILVIRELAE